MKLPERIDIHSLPLEDRMTLEKLYMIARAAGYEKTELQPVNRLVSFFKGDIRVNIYYTTFTVGTCLNHPQKGKTQLFRRNLSFRDIEEILKNPRLHTKKGYYEN